jgi:hypothetical protein
MSPDMNPIEHVWDFIGRKINQRNPKCQNIDELRTNGGLRVERAYCHCSFGLSDYHQERASPTYSQRKNKPRQLHPHPQKQLFSKCGCPEMKCFVGAKPLPTIMRWLTGQCSWTTTLGHIEPELYNICLQQEAVQTIPWPVMSPDMNPIEHVWGKNKPRQLHPHPQKQLFSKCGCPEMKCFVGAKPLHDRR